MKGTAPVRTAAQLRQAFDASFARAPVAEREEGEEMLAIRAQHHQLAIRVGEIAGIMRCPPLTAMPSRNPSLAGLARVRGALVAVYDLAALLDGGRSATRRGWIVACGGDRSVGLLFDELVGYARVLSQRVHSADSAAPAAPPRAVVRIGERPRTLLSVPALLGTIRSIAQNRADREE